MLARCLGLLLTVGAVAEAQPVCSAGSLRSAGASGTATLKLRPDRVVSSVGVDTTAKTVAQALKGNNAKLAAVLAALEAKGVTPQEIQTSQFEIHSARDENRKRMSGFEVSNRVSITRTDPAEAGALLQAAVNAGANQAGDFRLFVADSSSHRERGLELAFQDAKAKASTLASLSGATLGGVLCVAEGGYSTTGFSGITETIMVTAAPPAIEEGVEEVSFSLYLVFELR